MLLQKSWSTSTIIVKRKINKINTRTDGSDTPFLIQSSWDLCYTQSCRTKIIFRSDQHCQLITTYRVSHYKVFFYFDWLLQGLKAKYTFAVLIRAAEYHFGKRSTLSTYHYRVSHCKVWYYFDWLLQGQKVMYTFFILSRVAENHFGIL